MNYTRESKITAKQIDEIDFDNCPRKFSVERQARLLDVLRKRMAGKTLKQIAEIYGVSSHRIRQLEALGVELILFS